jgi:hypothetical protein
MSQIVAKFRCHVVHQFPASQYSGASERVSLHPVYSDNPEDENHKWSQATPSGEITMSITNPGACGIFKEGKEYLINFTEVEKAA